MSRVITPDVRTVKVLYITGWGRSGTTLMDNIVGSHEGVFTAGEITRIWQLGFVEGRRCGCGEPLRDCPFWTAVLQRAFDGHPPDAHRMIAMQGGPLGVLRTPALLSAARRRRPTPAAAEYAAVLSRIYRAIAVETGCRVLVDASKRPPDAVLAATAAGVDPYILHMVRDPRACAYSWQRQVADPSAAGAAEMHRHGPLMNAGHWVSWNLLAERVARSLPPGRQLRLRYEDFMSEPQATVAAVFGMLSEPPDGGPFVGEREVDLPGNHTIAGNPGRFRTGPVPVRLDDAWRAAQRPRDRCVTTALTLPWLRRYGYPWRVPSA